MLQAHDSCKGRVYTLSSKLYELEGKKIEYTRQVGFSKLQHEQLVKNYAVQHGVITRGEVMELCHLTKDQAYQLLKKLSEEEFLTRDGDRKKAVYYVKD